VPEEVRAAKRINAEGERIIDRANEEAERILAKAQEQAAFLIAEEGLTRAAEAEGRAIVAAGRDQAEATRKGADEYAASVLGGLEDDVARTLETIRKGLALLDERRAILRDGTIDERASETDGDVDDDWADEADPEGALPPAGR
jgi:hypothetical protein